MNTKIFSLKRWWAIVIKEFLQLKRDRVTFGMMIGIPIIQLTLFGYAINTDPKHLPTAVVAYDESEFTRSFIAGMKNSDYFQIIDTPRDEHSAKELLRQGKILFILTIPADFTHKLLRYEHPSLLFEADATDPIAVGAALSALDPIRTSLMHKDFTGALSDHSPIQAPFDIRIHRLYNPETITQYNIVPGLMGVVLTFTLTMMTALAITRENEKGTMENLLATPAQPLEIMSGKIIPYVFIGLIQSTIILAAAYTLFAVPFEGSLLNAYSIILLFIVVNLTIGITISSLAQNMLQAMQLSVFYFLPSILLSGFMFPFLGMPQWAQAIGEILPLTHFNRLIRGIVLKGNGFWELWPNIWPLLAIGILTMAIAVKFYRRTLD
ncbi:ABC transporter permease [Sulfuricurvum sp.]|uniref:ABC transporter permease n=1 Tax=Sulfuricurvum sp. TaxID=2025608 RepID=UPI00262535F7|nr:ABC transporter permease [Sulfuricurvum sp.]MDD4884443.1 ABC transporter permease [Sulfuricurvum sp.]